MKTRKDLKIGDKVIFNKTDASSEYRHFKDKIFTITGMIQCNCESKYGGTCPGKIFFKEMNPATEDGCFSYSIGVLYDIYEEAEVISVNNEFNIGEFF